MNVPVKGKKRKIHTDPYAGGEQSGKKARPDARQPLQSPLTSASAKDTIVSIGQAEISAPHERADTQLLGPSTMPLPGSIPTSLKISNQDHPLDPFTPGGLGQSLGPVRSQPLFSTSTIFPPTVFDPSTVDLTDTKYLLNLHRHKELKALCQRYGIAMKGRNEELVARVQERGLNLGT